MCDKDCISFGEENLTFDEVSEKKIIEVGAFNVNGSLRSYIEKFKPLEYVGVDIEKGPCVDKICNAYDLITVFGKESFDVLISTEMLEHVENWRLVISNFKNILKKNGILILTTRSFSFPKHDFPHDFWRYEEEDFRFMFSDFVINQTKKDTIFAGIFIKATKPSNFVEVDLSKYELYNINEKKRIL